MSALLKVIDTELALERAAGNEDLAKELFGMLLKELPIYRSELQLCLVDNNLTRMLEQIHKLNGSATYTGVPALKAATNDLETKLKRGETENIRTLVKGMLEEIDKVMVSAT
jgi:two-component system sensor histidine kinase BarA